ncbi:MAG: hypothetical protein AB203_00050 [Parcubacteria bacterium C7867-008]|nr:MAG: hypothetical protein AB203_00050 [Parcubacteria bacterium C7867-008]
MGIENTIYKIIDFINGAFVPLIFALAFAFFLFGVFKFFFLKGTEAKSREEGRKFMLGAIIALAVMISVWGLVNLLRYTFNLDDRQPNLPTFNAGNGGSRSNGSGSGNSGGGGTGQAPGPSSTGQKPGAATPTPTKTQYCDFDPDTGKEYCEMI